MKRVDWLPMTSKRLKKGYIRPQETQFYRISLITAVVTDSGPTPVIKLEYRDREAVRPSVYTRGQAAALVEALQTGLAMVDDMV